MTPRRSLPSCPPGRGSFPAWALSLLLGAFLPGTGALGQVTWQDLVLTGGISAEGYRGNLAAVSVPAVDSTDHAAAAVGELGLMGGVLFLNTQGRTLGLRVDAGLRQFAAGGFEVRDYAPRELVARGSLWYRQRLGSLGDLHGEFAGGGRRVEDRPPMPLFIQPGYWTLESALGLRVRPLRGIHLDGEVTGGLAEYRTGALTPQLALLDREHAGVEMGASWGQGWRLRVHGRLQAVRFPNQGTFDPSDPFRRDRTFSLGASWTVQSALFAQVGAEGTLNRSNSRRPEYNALSLRSVVSAPLPGEVTASLYAVLTAKRYVHKTEFARLVPGEEADNASVVFLELNRPLMVNLDGALRFGWTRAETDIGDSYFERYGATLLFRYRPRDR